MDGRLLELVDEFKEHVKRSSDDATEIKLSLARIEGKQERHDEKIEIHEVRHEKTEEILKDYVSVKDKGIGAMWIIGILWILSTAFEIWYFRK